MRAITLSLISSRSFRFSAAALAAMALLFFTVMHARAALSVTAATGGGSISADTANSTWTTLTGPAVIEGANQDLATGTTVINAPTGFRFNVGATASASVTADVVGNGCFTLSSSTATPTASTITFTVATQDSVSGSPKSVCRVTFSNIQVQPRAGTPLASGNITLSGTAGATGNAGALTEVAGTATQLVITTQPVGGASGAVLATQPVIAVRDAQGNTVTSDNSTQVTVAIQSGAGGTLGGTQTVTMVNGVATFTNVTLTGTPGTNYVLRFSKVGGGDQVLV